MNDELSYSLESKIDKDFYWRIKEITSLRLSICNRDSEQVKINIRAAFLLLYAHWEGHVKSCSKLYIEYLKKSDLTYSELKDNFSHIGFAWRMRTGFSINKYEYQKSSFDFFSNSMGDRFNADVDQVVATGANLKSETLKEIMCKIGLDYSIYELREKFIDETFLAVRNAIAHGEYGNSKVYNDGFIDVFDKIFLLITDFNELIKSSILEKRYLKCSV